MNKPFQKLLLAVAPLLLFGTARAAIDPGIVGADAQWVGYADLNGLRASVIGTQLLDTAEKAHQLQFTSSGVQIDFKKVLLTVGSITTYGTNLTHDPKLVDGAMILQGTASLRKIAEGLLVQATVTTPEKVAEAAGFPFPTYSVGGQVLIGFPTDTTIIVSKSKARLLGAVAVIQGAAPSLAKTPSSPINALLKNSDKTFLFVASVVPSAELFPQNGPQARILQMTKTGSIGLGEDGTQTFAHVALVAESDEMADKLTKILQGVTALLSLGESNNQTLTDFMNSAMVEKSGDTVTLHMEYASARLAEMIDRMRTGRGSGLGNRFGKVALEWKSEPATSQPEGAPPALTWKTAENVHLANGALITLAVRDGVLGRQQRLDRIEISPMDGSGTPLIFRASLMRLAGYRIPSREKVAVSAGPMPFAQFSFPGEDGVYKVRVHYSDGTNGHATFSLSVKDAESTPATPNVPARPDSP